MPELQKNETRPFVKVTYCPDDTDGPFHVTWMTRFRQNEGCIFKTLEEAIDHAHDKMAVVMPPIHESILNAQSNDS